MRLTAPRETAPERHAFVVDDDLQILSLVSKVLATLEFTAHRFTDGQELDGALSRWLPDIVILDLTLGNSDAVEVIRKLAAVRFAGEVLLISGRDLATLEQVQQIGVQRGLAMMPPLHKPFRVAELQSLLTGVKDRAAAPAAVLELEAAIRNNWLELWYQPKVDLETLQLCGAEALIRLRHPVHGLIEPERFLPPAGDRLYYSLTDFVVRRALSDWPAFARIGMTERIAINVPASVLQRPDFVATVRASLPRHPNFPGLTVEITEDEAIQDLDLARETAIQLKLYDVYVSIDDFGAGYSTLARLKELPFSEIKLDRRFVAGCADDKSKRDMCRAVIELAHRFTLVGVAEGIERAEDLEVLKEIGYPVGQGYLLGRPMPRDHLLQVLASSG